MILPAQILRPHPSRLPGPDPVQLLPRRRQPVALHEQHVPQRVQVLRTLQPQLAREPRAAVRVPAEVVLMHGVRQIDKVLGLGDGVTAGFFVRCCAAECRVADLVGTLAEELQKGVRGVLSDLLDLRAWGRGE